MAAAKEGLAMISRREAFFGAALAAWAVPLTAAHADQVVVLWTGRALTQQQGLTLIAAAEAIMPATDTPGATEARVAEKIDSWVADYCTPADAAAIRGALDWLEAEARAGGAPSFVGAGPARQAELLGRLDAQKPEPGARAPFAVLKEYVTVAFFTSKPGATKTLRYDPKPGAYHGCIPVSQVGRTWATS